jgi:ketosteroid isomerase-like protein
MKAIRVVALAILGLCGAIAFAQGESPIVRKEIEAVYEKWDRLVAKQDLKSLLAMIDKSFVMTDAEGKTMNYADMKKQMSSMVGSVRDCKSQITVNQIQEQGNEVVAWVTMKSSFKMKDGSKWVPVSFTARVAETLRKINGEWKFVAAQELPRT